MQIAFRDLLPTRYANVVPPPVVGSPPALDASNVRALQLTYSKFEFGGALNPKFSAGPFELTLEAAETY